MWCSNSYLTCIVMPEVKLRRISARYYECSAFGGFPLPNIHWEMNGITVDDNYSVKKQNGLFLVTSIFEEKNMNSDQTATLICVVSHPSFPAAVQINSTLAERGKFNVVVFCVNRLRCVFMH